MKYINYNAASVVKPLEAGQSTNNRKSSSAYSFEIGHQSSFDAYISCCCCCCYLSQSIPLYKYHDAPDFLHGNPFVIHGYRGKLSLVLCLQSLFTWSNDCLNIWSHLIGFFIFLFLLIWDNAVALPELHCSFTDQFIASIGLCCYQFCMLCSTGYHIFRCHSEKANLHWLALDMTGISVGILGCYLPAIHYGFYCRSVWRDIYLVIIVLLFTAILIWQTRPRYYSPRWFRTRVLLYVGLTAYGIVPAVHWISLNGGLQSPVVQLFAPKILVVYLLSLLGLFFYMSKFPERWFPGTFDYVGSSHQWWHLIAVVIFIWWHDSGRQLLAYRLSHPCYT